ncbi:hypothetical protein [Microbacterium sp. KRD172]|uniref:hypothetical protein n=1 Tax=Microbacterium sp. KRD172 TaxID=2729727 RepID=UPI0019D0D3CC|nr:hypothetical protein [Microbacterium sp. KRD172]
MRLTSIAALGIISVAMLAGCAATTPSQPVKAEPATTSSPLPTPTIDPGPVTLTTDEASDRYLGIVCQRNGVIAQMNEAFSVQEETYLNSGEADASAVKVAAIEVLRVNSMQIALFDDPYYTWPEGLIVHLKNIRDASMTQSSMFDSIANASSYEAAYYMTAPETPEATTSAQEIRYQLQLSPDTTASCQGYETATDTLHAEMLERTEYLATFAEED